jgi:nitrite reductase (NO-forming)
MWKSNHSGIKATTPVFGLLLFVFMAGTEMLDAQTAVHHMQMKTTTTAARPVDIVRDPADVPQPIGNRAPGVVHVTLTAKEVVGRLDPANGTTYRYWTFNGKVPAPMIRVRQGDTVEVTLQNDPSSHMAHSVDFHAALGPGGGAAFSQAAPGQSKTFAFQATTPGLFVYHCGTPMIAEHIANGMYGLILVEPPGGLQQIDHEYYVMQGEIYTTASRGKTGLQQFSDAKLLQEDPEYFIFNGAVDAVSEQHPLTAHVGDTVRIFFGDAGPNKTSSFHVVGEIFTRDYALGSLTSPALTGVQTASVPPGGAAILELTASVPGRFDFMDHAMARMAKGLMGTLEVTGAQNEALMHAGPASPGPGPAESSRISGMTQADVAEAMAKGAVDSAPFAASTRDVTAAATTDSMAAMPMRHGGATAAMTVRQPGMVPAPTSLSKSAPSALKELNGCLTLQSDGKVMLKILNSSKVYRLEAQPFLFSENANRLVHVSGSVGSVVAIEDPNVPSFVVDTVGELAPNCYTKVSAATIRKALAKPVAAAVKGTVGMSDMRFIPTTMTVNVGEKVTWKNSSQVFHNVVDDSSKALYKVDVSLPSGSRPFDSGLLQPGQTFSRVFTTPGVYRYVCTLHEGNGMKGVVIVRPEPMLARK